MHVTIGQSAAITIENTDFVDNFGQRISEMFIAFQTDIRSSDVTILHGQLNCAHKNTLRLWCVDR